MSVWMSPLNLMILGQTVFEMFDELISWLTNEQTKTSLPNSAKRNRVSAKNAKWFTHHEMKYLKHLSKIVFSKMVEALSRNRDPSMTPNPIFSRSEVAGDFICGPNVNTIENYVVVNLEVASSSSFRDNKNITSWRRRRRTRTSTIAMSSVGCLSSSFVHHKVSGSHISKTVWTRINKYHTDIQMNLPCSHTGYDVISHFWRANHRKCNLRRLWVEFLGNSLTDGHQPHRRWTVWEMCRIRRQ